MSVIEKNSRTPTEVYSVNEKRNLASATVISAQDSPVAIRIMHTDEEGIIAKAVCCVLGLG